jgi:DNA (cytosine-5)-methyltransferase 1
MGTGGNNVSMVATIPIQDGRDINKEQNGLGVGDEGDPSYTLDRTGAQSVAIMPIQGTIIGRSDTAGPQGKGYGEDGDPMYTLDSVSGHGVATLMRMREGKPGGGKGPLISEDKSLTIATSNDQTLLNKGTVRRLTPVECERLQGFPDDWTAGQSDSSRYKQMGNAVAVPVVEWVIGNICDIV